jgi:integrase
VHRRAATCPWLQVACVSVQPEQGGVVPAGPGRTQFNFVIDGVRFRPTLPWAPNRINLERAGKLLLRIRAQIEAGTFCFSETFPDYRRLNRIPAGVRAKTRGEVFDDFLRHEAARVTRGDLAPVSLASHRQIIDHTWRPQLGHLPFLGIQHSMLIKIADAQRWTKKTYNNAVSALRRAFAFGYLDYLDRRDPAAALRCARIGKKDRPAIDPFSIQDAESFIAALRQDWGEVQGNYDEFRFFTGLRPSEQIALTVMDCDRKRGALSINKARVHGISTRIAPRQGRIEASNCARALLRFFSVNCDSGSASCAKVGSPTHTCSLLTKAPRFPT